MRKNELLLKWTPFILLGVVALAGIVISPGTLVTQKGMVAGDVAWVLVASTLVFLMTPGLSFFYGGMVSRRNVISTMLQSFIATGLISILWVVVGFGLAFGDSWHGLIGNPIPHLFFGHMINALPWKLAPTIPLLVFALFQMKFAVITPALVVGAVAERIQFKAYLLFMVLFSLLIYCPIAHWTWNPGGILFKFGVLDFAGGTVVHISAGCAALAGALVLKRRRSHMEKLETKPANIPFVLLGTGLLWFGWFGFNAGSALAANDLAALAFATTNTATATAGLTWVFFDSIRGRKPSAMGFCVGAVVGLVAITPAAGFVGIPQSIAVGFVAAVVSNMAVYWKSKSALDDTLDVFPCHGVGGMVGMLMTGIFASTAINSGGANGWFYGNITLFFHQLFGMLLVVCYSFLMGLLIFKLVDWIYPLRVTEEEEEIGLDLTQHDERYHPVGSDAILHEMDYNI